MQPSPVNILKSFFGFDAFRPLQHEIITAVLEGGDVLALMPTGGGKSLCYQIPGLTLDGLCLVVSPLIALMNDQVQQLRKKNITAFAIHSGMSRKEVINVLELAAHSNCKFLYISPERIESPLFREFLPGLGVNLIAVDEAHCISQWGYDFRPPYLRIAQLREELPEVPLIALTASATPLVQKDICEKLSCGQTNRFIVFRQSFERPNLSYSVFNINNRIPKIIEILNNVQGSALIYCKTRKRTKEIADLLRLQQMEADYYHAGLTTAERSQRQQEWIQNKIRVMVCTNAFGMGIDKPDVRTVIHADVPDCLENYYQEAGRAGRDGKKAFAILLYDDLELKALDQLPTTRYPDRDTLKSIYGSLVNYLQLPEGDEPGESFDFDLRDFIQKFKLDITTALYGLKALEQDGWINFNEQVFLPSTVRFTTYKTELYEYEAAHPHLEPLIKTLLRTYEGIYDYPVSVSERYMTQLVGCEPELLKEQLQRLHFDHIIDYRPQKDSPQLSLNRTRIKVSELTIDVKLLNERKQIFIERIHQIMQYAHNRKDCRSRLIGNYFGDESLKECGICDNCLSKRKSGLSKDRFNHIVEHLQKHLQNPASSLHLFKELKNFDKEQLRTTINFLVEEGKIHIQRDGKLKWA